MNFFFVSGKQMCGRKSLNSLTQAQVTRNETGVENCLRILKIEQLDNKSLKLILVCSLFE